MSQAVVCINCGRENPPGSTSCEHCSRSSWSPPTRRPGLLISLGVALLVYLAGCNVGLFLRHLHPPAPPAQTLQVDSRP